MLQENQFLKLGSAPVTSNERLPLDELYTASQRRLKKMAQDFPFEPPSQRQIEQKINIMRTKLSARDQSDTEGEKDKVQKQIKERHRTQPSRNTLLEENVNNLTKPINEVAKAKSFLKMSKVTNCFSRNERSLSYKNPFKPEMYKYEQLIRDKQKYPFKYKIICQQLGFNEEKVHHLKQNEVQRLKEQYQKNKGLEYLREGTLQVKISQFKKRQLLKNGENLFKPKKRGNPKSLIHHIFGNLNQKKQIKRSFSTKQMGKKTKMLKQLSEQEQMLGKLVFQRVKRHLKDEKNGVDYFKRVHSQENIDDALVSFLRAKIQKAQVAMK